MNLPPIEDIENSDEFKSLNIDDQETVLTNYFSEAEKTASNENDLNNNLKKEADRKRSAFNLRYKTLFPEDTKFSDENINSTPDLKSRHDELNTMYSDLDYNVNQSLSSAKAFRASDMEDGSRKLAYKPYRYKGKSGYTVVYPNGDIESIPGIENESQLTEFFKTKRTGQFAGKREGFFDKMNPIADTELDSISDQIKNTASGVAGLAGDVRKGLSGMIQGKDIYNIESINRGLNRYRDAQSTIEQLDPIIARLEKRQSEFPDRYGKDPQLTELKLQKQQAQDSLANKDTGIGNNRVVNDLNPLSEGVAISPEESAPQLTEAYSKLAKEMEESSKIKGSRVISELDSYIASQDKENGGIGSYASYFKNNPSQIAPYILSVVSSSLPDVVAITGGSLAAGAAGGPGAAMAAGQSLGFAREYSATLLSEMQIRAAKEGKNLDSTVIEGYLNDPTFIEATKTKAKTRGSIIGLSDAITGGIATNITKSVGSVAKKVAASTAIETVTEATGEALAQVATEPKVDWRSVIEEGLGSLGAAGPTTIAAVYQNSQQTKAKMSVALDAATEEASNKLSLKERVGQMRDSLLPEAEVKEEVIIPEEPVKKEAIVIPEETKKEEVVIPKEEVQLTEEEDVSKPVVDIEDVKVDTVEDAQKDGPSLISRALSFFNRNDNPDITEEWKNEKAKEILSDDFNRSIFNILSDTSSYDRIMQEMRESGYDDTRAGSLMEAVGLTPENANKTIVTNVLGNIWSHALEGKVLLPHEKKGLLVAEAIDKVYRDKYGVTSYYDATQEELDSISPDTHALLNLAPDEINEFDGGESWPTQSQAYSSMSAEESVDRYNKAREATIIRDTQSDLSLDNKFKEASRLNRPNIKVTKISDLPEHQNPLALASTLKAKYPNGYVVKSEKGFSGQNINFGHSDYSVRDMANVFQKAKDEGRLDDVYVESYVKPAEGHKSKTGGFNEFRVHLYVDKKGEAHVFKNLTFNKSRSYYEQNRRGADPSSKEDAFFLVPDNPNSPVVQALQKYAKDIMSGKKEFADNIFGLDIAYADNNGTVEPFVFETNPMTYGMSGWLGRPLAMTEILSEMTGRPSVMAGLYQLAKLDMTKEQLNSIASAINERIDSPYKNDIMYSQARDTGMNLYNPYIPKDNWMKAMQRAFNAPLEFFKKLYNAITNVFRDTVDVHFAERQGAKPRPSTLKSPVLPPVKGSYLGEYIDQLIVNPQLTESQKQVLNYVRKNASDTFLNNVKVKRTSSATSSYQMSKATISLSPDATPSTAVHEIVHAVTADFINYNNDLTQGIYGHTGDYDNTIAIKSLYDTVNPNNYDKMIAAGVSPDYISAGKIYLSLLNNLGITQASVDANGAPVGENLPSSYNYQAANPSIPYGAISMSEMMAEVLTNTAFQKQLAKMPSVFSNAKNLFDELMQLIGRILRIPVNKSSLLFEAMGITLSTISNPENYFFSASDLQLNSESIKPVDIGTIEDVPYKTDEVSQNTKASYDKAELPSQKEFIAETASEERKANRFSKLKSLYPDVLAGMEYNGTNLPAARELVINKFYAELNEVSEDDSGKKVSKLKKEAAALLVENKVLAVEYLDTFINDPSITDNHATFFVDAMEYVLNETADPINMSTRRIKYYNNVLESFSDGGTPVGFKFIIADRFVDQQMEKARASGPINLNIAKPILNAIRRPLFGAFRGEIGSTATLASEMAYMTPEESSRKWLADFIGTFRDQIDAQQLENEVIDAEFQEHLNNTFPKGGLRPLAATKIGIVARLTQYSQNSNETPEAQIFDRYRQLTESLPTMEAYDKNKAALAQKALDEIFGGQDITTLGNANDIISFLQRSLSSQETSLLNKVRDLGSRYLPALQTVKAMTKNAVLEQYVNYVHDSSVTPKESGEGNMLTVFNSMSDVLQDRKGIDPNETYPELDIRAIAERQNKASTYEKFTGIERYLLANALNNKSPITRMIDSGDIKKLSSQRIKELIGSAHNSMVRAQPTVGGFIGFVESLMNLVLGHVIVGVNALTKNMISSSVARFGLASLSIDALKNAFVYDMNSSKVKLFIKNNFPTQYNRASEYDTLKGRDARWDYKSKYLTAKDIGDNTISALLKTAPYLPTAIINQYQKIVLNNLSNLSNAFPERRNAFAIWTAAYIHYAQQNGTVKDAADFTVRMPVDKNAATQASDFVTRSLGYAPQKQDKGSFWNGSTTTKAKISKMFFVFRQQATGLSVEFQNSVVNASRLYKSGDIEGGTKQAAFAATLLFNSMSFRAMSMALGSTMIWGGLAGYFNASDDEEKKKKLLEAQQKYTATSLRNNTRDFVTESLMMVVPVATSAFAVEAAASWGIDTAKMNLEWKDDSLELVAKKSMKEEVEDIEEQIKALDKVVKEKDKRGLDTSIEDEGIEKLEYAKSQLTEKIKFKYFPNRPIKAFLSAFGAYGIAGEALTDRIKAFTDNDLDTEEKIQLANMLSNEYAYNDPVAGSNFAWDILRHPSDFLRNFTEADKKPGERIPTELYWKSIIKMGQNPAIVVERGRKAMAQDALRERNKLQKKVDKLKERYVGK